MYEHGIYRRRSRVAMVLKLVLTEQSEHARPFQKPSIMHLQTILMHSRNSARIRTSNSSLDRSIWPARSCIRALSNENNRAWRFTCLRRHLLYDWRRNKSSITIRIDIWHHFDYTLILYRFFIPLWRIDILFEHYEKWISRLFCQWTVMRFLSMLVMAYIVH